MNTTDIQKNQTQALDKSQAAASTEMERTRDRLVFVPRVDIYERDDALVVIADLPGVDEKSVEINVEKRVLTISGRVEPREYPDRRATWTEYRSGDYERSFTLSDEVNIEKIQAGVKQGVLTLDLPKAEKAKPRKITVKAG